MYEDKNEEITDVVRNKVYYDVLGPEKRNKVRGFGAGINWEDVPGIVTEDRPTSRGIQELRAAYDIQAETLNVAQQEVIKLRLEATERENRWSLEAANLVQNLRKEQAEVMALQKTQMELEIMEIKRELIEFMVEFRNSKSKGKKDDGSSNAVLQSLLSKVDIRIPPSGRNDESSSVDYEVVEMDTDNGALPRVPQGKPNN